MATIAMETVKMRKNESVQNLLKIYKNGYYRHVKSFSLTSEFSKWPPLPLP